MTGVTPSSIALRRAVKALADLGIGPRAAGRLLGLSPSHVYYYWKAVEAELPPDADLFARLPQDVQQLVLDARRARA